jgi:hypothetical protein
MQSALSKLSSIFVATMMVIGLLMAISRRDIYWTVIALWGLLLVAYPTFRHHEMDRPGVCRLLPLATVPFILGLLLDMEGGGVLPLSSPWYWLAFSVAIFSMSLITVAYSDFYGGLRTNLNFALQLTFMLYMSMVTLQGPVYYYSDVWLGTTMLTSNGGLMSNITLTALAGLVLTLAFHLAATRGAPSERVSEREEGAI